MAKVIVVTPVYSTARNQRMPMLLQALLWAQQQTHQDMVHVIVDDGSTDETPDVLERIARRHPSVLVFHQPNSGSSAAVNFGVEQALKTVMPDYITISHSDDLLLPTSLEQRIAIAERYAAAMVYSDMLAFSQHDDGLWLYRAPDFSDGGAFYHSMLNGGYLPFATMLWKRDFFLDRLGGYDREITSAEDLDIAIRSARELSLTGDTHASFHSPTVAYRFHDNNLGTQNVKDGTKWRCYKRIVRKHFQGRTYPYHLARYGFRMLRTMIPNSIKTPLRHVRDYLLSSPRLPYAHELADEMRQVESGARLLLE